MKKTRILYKEFLIWRLQHIKEAHLMLILSFVIGLCCGLAAVLLKNTVHYTYLFITDSAWFSVDSGNFLFLAYPMIGVFLTTLFVRYVVRANIGHGVSNVLYALSRDRGVIATHHCYSSIVASSITVGFGGSLGLEAPVVLTGSAIGSNIGRVFRLNYKMMITLVGCGAAGAVAAAFKAPIAGIIFVFEVLLLDLTMATAIPLLISALTASMISFFFFGGDVQFDYQVIVPFELSKIPFYLLLGVASAIASVYFLRVNSWMSQRFSRIPLLRRILVGGVIIGVLIFLFPPLFGEGYVALNYLLHGNTSAVLENSFFYQFQDNEYIFLGVLLAIVVLKVIVTSTTLAIGGVGGVFAPSLFLGGFVGFLVARAINVCGGYDLPETNFALIGMAAVMTGIMHSPLTASFLIAEITNGYGLFAPLLMACAVAYLVSKPITKYSIYAYELAKKGDLMTHDKDKAALQLLDKSRLIERDVEILSENDYLGDIIQAIEHSKRNIFPVVSENGSFVGVVTLNDLRSVMFNPSLYGSYMAKDFMQYSPSFIVDINDSMETIIDKFKGSESYNVIVVDKGKYKGVLSRANVFSMYRKFVHNLSDE